MARTRRKPHKTLAESYPPSPPCGCTVCQSYCVRPGWWTVEEAARAFNSGYCGRMMLEIAPERTYGVLSPAFRGCEGSFALKQFADRGCCFLHETLCELHGTGFQPLECRFCHHDRPGLGQQCHAALEQDWMTPAGRALVANWCRQMGLWDRLKLFGLENLKK